MLSKNQIDTLAYKHRELNHESRTTNHEPRATNHEPRIARHAEDQHCDTLDLLRKRVGLLAGKDKVLMTMYLENGASFRQLAKLAGVSEATIARRIRRLTDRLTNGGYITCLRTRVKFSEAELSIAKDYFLTGLSTRKIAASRHCTRYNVRKTIKRIKYLQRKQI
jgi:predicted DNA-binding protein YlxM (UPF0122 family)